MRRRAFLAALFVASFLGGLGAADIKSGPQPGTKDEPTHLPGSFEILSVTPEKNAGRFHCPVSDFGLNPAVLIFTQVEPGSVGQEIVTLLKNLEATVAKHPEVQLGVCVVFLNDGGYREALENKSEDLPKAIEFKDQRQQKIKDFAKTHGLQHVALGIGSLAGPAKSEDSKDAHWTVKYQISKDADWTILICNRLQVIGNFAYDKDGKPQGERIMAEINKLLPQKK